MEIDPCTRFQEVLRTSTRFIATFHVIQEDDEDSDEEDVDDLVFDEEMESVHVLTQKEGSQSSRQEFRVRNLLVNVNAFKEDGDPEPIQLPEGSNFQLELRGPVIFTSPWWQLTAALTKGSKESWTFSHVPFLHLSGTPRHFIAKIGLGDQRFWRLGDEKGLEEFLRELSNFLDLHEIGVPVDLVRGFDMEKFELWKQFLDHAQRHFKDAPHEKGALRFPQLASCIGTLFGRKAPKVLSAEREKLAEMRVYLEEEPWVFGFECLMKRLFGVSKAEAIFRNFELCAEFGKIEWNEKCPVLVKDSLLIYDFVKETKVNREKSTTAFVHTVRKELCQKLTKPENFKCCLDFLVNIGALVREKSVVNDRLFLPSYFSHESGIARTLCQFQKSVGPSPIDGDDFDLPFQTLDQQRSAKNEQKEAAKKILTNKLTILTGCAGSGKSTIVGWVISHLGYRPDDVLLTAFTAKAALNLTSKIEGAKGHTLHSVIFSFYNQGNQKAAAEYGDEPPPPWKFSNVRVLVIDEFSFVPTDLFYYILSILFGNAKLEKIVLIGDKKQLPSIEPGCLMRDLCLGFPQQVARLTENHRSESEDIAYNAKLCAKQNSPAKWKQSDSFKFEPYSKTNELIAQFDHFSGQIISFLREDVKRFNRVAFESQHVGTKWANRLFGIGDKVACGRNRSSENPDFDDGQPDLINGEIYFISEFRNVENKKLEGKEFAFSRRPKDSKSEIPQFAYVLLQPLSDPCQAIQLDCDTFNWARFSHAFAKTIHTFQGSEMDQVIYPISYSQQENWQHVYTAISRGRKRVTICQRGDWDTIKTVLRKPLGRFTGLMDRICECREGRAASLRRPSVDATGSVQLLVKYLAEIQEQASLPSPPSDSAEPHDTTPTPTTPKSARKAETPAENPKNEKYPRTQKSASITNRSPVSRAKKGTPDKCQTSLKDYFSSTPQKKDKL